MRLNYSRPKIEELLSRKKTNSLHRNEFFFHRVMLQCGETIAINKDEKM